MSTELRIEWVNFFKELFGLENLRFQRCVQPENAIGDPMLVVFSDGSNIAYGACAYAAPHNSNRGTDNCLIGAIRFLAITNRDLKLSIPTCHLT
jgi:hypothetical protein